MQRVRNLASRQPTPGLRAQLCRRFNRCGARPATCPSLASQPSVFDRTSARSPLGWMSAVREPQVPAGDGLLMPVTAAQGPFAGLTPCRIESTAPWYCGAGRNRLHRGLIRKVDRDGGLYPRRVMAPPSLA